MDLDIATFYGLANECLKQLNRKHQAAALGLLAAGNSIMSGKKKFIDEYIKAYSDEFDEGRPERPAQPKPQVMDEKAVAGLRRLQQKFGGGSKGPKAPGKAK